MSKKLLEESTIRQFMKLASLEPLSENFFEEGRRGKKKSKSKRMRMREEDLSEAEHEDKIEEMMGSSVDPNVGLEEEIVDLEEIEMPADALEEAMPEMEEAYDTGIMEEEDVEMEASEDDMEAEINITPDQARAIIAVADMLKDIMPDLEAPEGEEEMEMDMDAEADEADADMDAADADADLEDADADEEKEEAEEDEAESLEEQIMNRVKARLRELKSK